MPFLSVVLPCYNEENNLKNGVLDEISSYLDKQKYDSEVIIVDDGSNDKSLNIIEDYIANSPKFRLIKNAHQGKAFTVITGMLNASGQIVLFSDMDQSTPIAEAEKLLPYLKEGFDVAIGGRHSQRKGAPLSRLIMARGFMFLRTIILGLGGIDDTQCGFKAFKKEVAHNLFNKLKLYGKNKKEVKGSLITAGFDVEVLFLAKKMGYKIKEVPVNWHYVKTRRVNPLKDSWHGLVDMIKLKINEARGLYD